MQTLAHNQKAIKEFLLFDLPDATISELVKRAKSEPQVSYQDAWMTVEITKRGSGYWLVEKRLNVVVKSKPVCYTG